MSILPMSHAHRPSRNTPMVKQSWIDCVFLGSRWRPHSMGMVTHLRKRVLEGTYRFGAPVR